MTQVCTWYSTSLSLITSGSFVVSVKSALLGDVGNSLRPGLLYLGKHTALSPGRLETLSLQQVIQQNKLTKAIKMAYFSNIIIFHHVS